MSYQENQEGRIKRQSTNQAINLAMEGRWKEAVDVNKNIIEHFPNDIDAFNRLGKAYMEIGSFAEAREAYEKALKLDQYNTIARKNLQRLEQIGESEAPSEIIREKVNPHLFIEEIGKAGVVSLYQVAPQSVLVKVLAGDKVNLIPQDSVLRVETIGGEYLGLVSAKYSQRLIKLMTGGNKYTAAVVSSGDEIVNVIIREVYQDPSQMGQVSFPGRRLEEIQPYGGDRILRSDLEEEEEEIVESSGYGEDSIDTVDETVEDSDDKDWNQEA